MTSTRRVRETPAVASWVAIDNTEEVAVIRATDSGGPEAGPKDQH